MIRINYKSDFSVRVTIKDTTGEIVPPPSDNPWWLHFTDIMGTCWKCGFDGSSYEDCSIDGDDIICYINNPGFAQGKMSVTFCNNVPDAHFADGTDNKVTPVMDDLFLWPGASDTSDEISMDMIVGLIAPQITDASIDASGDLNLEISYKEIHIQ